ncbi:hypothetical protein AB1E18_018040 [Capra hircus]
MSSTPSSADNDNIAAQWGWRQPWRPQYRGRHRGPQRRGRGQTGRAAGRRVSAVPFSLAEDAPGGLSGTGPETLPTVTAHTRPSSFPPCGLAQEGARLTPAHRSGPSTDTALLSWVTDVRHGAQRAAASRRGSPAGIPSQLARGNSGLSREPLAPSAWKPAPLQPKPRPAGAAKSARESCRPGTRPGGAGSDLHAAAREPGPGPALASDFLSVRAVQGLPPWFPDRPATSGPCDRITLPPGVGAGLRLSSVAPGPSCLTCPIRGQRPGLAAPTYAPHRVPRGDLPSEGQGVLSDGPGHASLSKRPSARCPVTWPGGHTQVSSAPTASAQPLWKTGQRAECTFPQGLGADPPPPPLRDPEPSLSITARLRDQLCCKGHIHFRGTRGESGAGEPGQEGVQPPPQATRALGPPVGEDPAPGREGSELPDSLQSPRGSGGKTSEMAASPPPHPSGEKAFVTPTGSPRAALGERAGVAAAACSYVSVRVLDGKLGERPPGSGAHSHSVDGGSCLRFPPNPETLPASSQLTAPGGPCQE